jgi:hypothetical protein
MSHANLFQTADKDKFLHHLDAAARIYNLWHRMLTTKRRLTTKTPRHEGALGSPRNSAAHIFKNTIQKRHFPEWLEKTSCSSCLRVFVVTLLLCTPVAFPDEPAEKPDLAAIASRQAYDQNLKQFKDNPDYLILPGLLANRKDKTVRLYARATGLAAGDPVEFFIIPADSGKDYESLTVAFVKPSEVNRALQFIGMKGGRSVNYNNNEYWPKGERVLMTVEWASHHVRAEELVLDTRTKKPLPLTGLVFTGSYTIKPEDGAKEMFAADVSDSRSIASVYNERSTVLDLPYQWPQGQVYGLLKPNPDHKLEAGAPIQILLEPEHKDGKTRVRDLALKVLQKDHYTLLDSSNKPLASDIDLVHLLAEFGKFTETAQDPFVTIDVSGNLNLQQVHEFFSLIQTLDRETGIRVEAPPPGQLYYRAFFPDEQWRDRTKRLGRPWELHPNVGNANGSLSGTLILPADDIDNNGGKGDLKFVVNSAEELAKTLKEKSDRWSQTVYIFAPPDLKYGALLDFIRPAMKTHPGVYIFLPK